MVIQDALARAQCSHPTSVQLIAMCRRAVEDTAAFLGEKPSESTAPDVSEPPAIPPLVFPAVVVILVCAAVPIDAPSQLLWC